VKESRQRRVMLPKCVGEANVQLDIPTHDYHKCTELTRNVFYEYEFLLVLLIVVMFIWLTAANDSQCDGAVDVHSVVAN